MGGKLFNLPRMPRAQYLQVEAELRAFLDRRLDRAYRIPRYYGEKPDFGDLDVIVPARPDWGELRAQLARELGIEQTKIIGHVYSTVFRGLQADFFAVAPEYLDSTYNFMSFNDLGNLLGRICRRFNLKYGEHGLSWVFRRERHEHYKVDLPLTQNFEHICSFLQLPYSIWSAGFASLREVFDWVLVSPYFSVEPYLDDLAGTLLKKSRHRTTIVRFIEYLKENQIDRRPEFRERTSYVAEVSAAFPEARLEAQIEAEREKERRAFAIAEKFNGTIVMQLRPELQGKALSELMYKFKRSVPDFEEFILKAAPEEIARRIRELEV